MLTVAVDGLKRGSTPPLKSLVVKGRISTPYVTVNCKVFLKTVFKAVLLSGGRRGESLC